ncbi:MAG TPA: HD domain-containing protein, partial [Roseiflexaceae bacterium]|nr:HD domain-containing protein [Roseiflexaceae bacterium]
EARIAYAEAWGIEVLPEERQVPMIIHQKLSAYMAEQLFGVRDAAILSAIGCHTTLKAGAGSLDRVVFLADKLKWDGQGDPPYLADLEQALHNSVDAACAWFVRYLWERRATLLVIHPWLAAAHAELEQRARP